MGSRSLAGLPRKVCIAGARGVVRRGNPKESPPEPTTLIRQVLGAALEECRMNFWDLDGLIAVPSLYESHFMEAHYQATRLGLFKSRISGQPTTPIRCRTIDTGGAGPVSALLGAKRMIETEGCEVVAVVAGDCVGSMDGNAFLAKADGTCQNPENPLPSPVIPHGYDLVTQYMIKTGLYTRDDFRLAPCVESIHASRNSMALLKEELTLQDVQDARDVTPNISLLECARRADGAAAIVLASNRFLARQGILRMESEESVGRFPVIISSGEASGPLFPPDPIQQDMFSCEDACRYAYEDAQLAPDDIDFFGLYDCFPVCLIRAIEAAGFVDRGKAGDYLRECYEEYHQSARGKQTEENARVDAEAKAYQEFLRKFPINTHGGLLCYGAPWEVPAAFNIIEAVQQLRGAAIPSYFDLGDRQIKNCRRALVYGNGGIFSASAVAIIGSGRHWL